MDDLERSRARVALVGYGLGGAVFHAPLIDTTPGLSLEVIVTSDPGRRAAAGARYPGAQLLSRVDDLFPLDGLDLVVVSVPNAHHFAVAETVLRAGISAVIDKPVTPTSVEARRLAEMARNRSVSVIPYHNRRWDGDYLTAAELIQSEALGDVWRLESRFERWRPGPPSGPAWKQDRTIPGGGALYDLGSHLIDQAIHLFGRPTAVYAELKRRGGGPDDDAFAALDYGGGPMVHIWASSTAAQLGPRFRVLGSRAAYLKYGLDPQEEALRAGRLPNEPGWGQEAEEAWGQVGSVGNFKSVRTRPGAYPHFYAGIAAHLLGDAPPPVALEDAIVGLEVIEAAMESANSRSVIAMV
jgi:predicted dehydrogenase